MADNTNRYFDRPGFGNHNVPRRQTVRTTISDNGPKHGGLRRNNRIPKASRNPKRPE